MLSSEVMFGLNRRGSAPPRELTKEEREERQRTYLVRAALIGVPALILLAWVLFSLAWWLPFVFIGACGLLVVGMMKSRPRRIRLDLDR
jgi:CHASE2 domain-containing sensor protein